MDVTRTFDLLQRYQDKFISKDDALAGKVKGEWVKYSSQDYIDNANYISYGLLELGYSKGEKIATICNNRPEWNFLDLGMAQAGIIHLPIFTTLAVNGYKEILSHGEAVAVFVADNALYKKIQPIADSLEGIKKVYTFDEVEGAGNWKEVLELGKANKDKWSEEIEKIKSGIDTKDPVTLIYTSGTTGNSKGVLLSHQNLTSNSIAASGVFNLKSDERYLSILPICHVGERMAIYQTQYSGCSIYYAENLGTISNDLLDVKPHGFGAVPRVLEKVYDKIIAKGNKLTGIKKKLFFWALDLGLKYKLDGANGPWYEFQLMLANKIIFSKWRDAMGGNVGAIGIGGAMLQPRLERVFWAAGIKLLNMYGLTETSPIITINRQAGDDLKLGSVGAKIEGVEVKIAEDGEILCRGANVMIGYYKDEEATELAINSDGWFHTGDIGVLDDGKYLRITDRKKEIFKLSNGKYVSPQGVENLFKESVYIDQLMVIGEGEKFTSALISPNNLSIKEWCKEEGVEFTSIKELISNGKVSDLFNGIVKEFNSTLGKDEQVKRFRLVPEEWTPDTGEMSPTLKLKRRVLMDNYKAEIDDIFQH